MTDAQLIEALTSCYDTGWLDAKNVENRYDTDEDLQKRAEAVVAKATDALLSQLEATDDGGLATAVDRVFGPVDLLSQLEATDDNGLT
jgi:hypothetical protein